MPPPKSDHDLIALQGRVEALQRSVTRLEEQQDGLSSEIRDAIGRVRHAVDSVQRAILEHVTGEMNADSRRDCALRDVAVDLAHLASDAGKQAGKKEGHKAIWLSVVIAILPPAITTAAKAIWG
jgi:hypothetical protein